MQNNVQTQAKRTRQSYISRWEKQRGSLEAEPPAARGQRWFGGGASDAVVIILLFFQKHIFNA